MPTARLLALIDLQQSGRLDEAEAGYRECLRKGDGDAASALATLLLQRERYVEAAQYLQPLVDAAPDNPGLATNLSIALRHCGRNEDALGVARCACALAPTLPGGWNARGLAALELGHVDEALASFATGLRHAPAHPALGLHHAHALRRLGRADEALAAYAQVVRRHPDLVDAWRGLATTQSALGQVRDALHSRRRALHLRPQSREVALEHAVALMEAGDVAAAVHVFEATVRANKDDAHAWSWLGRARLKQNDLRAARAAFEQASARDPRDPVIAHFHAALSGRLPDAVEIDFIRSLFDDFADRFELTLVKHLAYDTPARLARFLRQHDADGAASVLDLGCGTGLVAQELARTGRVIDGVDLSPRMLEYARKKALYRELHAAELVTFLHRADAQWELIVAADVFIYLGDLGPVFAAVRDRLPAGGRFAFSIECSAGDRTELQPASGRYRHVPERVCRELEDAGLGEIVREAVVLRLESGQPVAGELLLARRVSIGVLAGSEARAGGMLT